MNYIEYEMYKNAVKGYRSTTNIDIPSDGIGSDKTVLYGVADDGYHVHVYSLNNKIHHIKYNDFEIIELGFETLSDIIFDTTYHPECCMLEVLLWLEGHKGLRLKLKDYMYTEHKKFFGKIIQTSC